MQSPEVRRRLDVEGAEAVVSTPDQLRNFMAAEISRLGTVMKKAQGTREW